MYFPKIRSVRKYRYQVFSKFLFPISVIMSVIPHATAAPVSTPSRLSETSRSQSQSSSIHSHSIRGGATGRFVTDALVKESTTTADKDSAITADYTFASANLPKSSGIKIAATVPSSSSGAIWDTWTDRRPIGVLEFGFGAGPGPSPTNPLGWSNGGPAAFGGNVSAWQQDMVDNAKRTAANIVAMGGQGVIVWDIEGTPLTPNAPDWDLAFVGDPRLLQKISPEMNGVANRIFQVFKNAGLKVGVCIRGQKADLPNQTQHSYPNSQAATTDIAGKIKYAINRWGASIFYEDSNDALAPEVVQNLYKQFPNILIIPEHTYDNGQELSFVKSSAPLTYPDPGDLSPPTIRSNFPQAFSALFLVAQSTQSMTAGVPAMTTAVRNGSIMLWQAWYDNEETPIVKQVYQAAGKYTGQ